MNEERFTRGEVLLAGTISKHDRHGMFQDCLLILLGDAGTQAAGGHLIEVEILVFDHFGSDSRIPGRLFLLADDASASERKLPPQIWNSALPSILSVDEFVKSHGEFVLSLRSRSVYRRLVEILDPAAAQRLLIKARDIAALNAFSPGSKVLARARRTETFRDVLLRGDEEVFAFVSIRSTLNDLMRASSLSEAATLEVVVPLGSQLELPVLLSFGEALQTLNPINVVIGSNGQGKTRLLLGLAKAILDGKCWVSRGADTKAVDPGFFKIVAFTYEAAQWSPLRRRGVEVVAMGVDARSWRQSTSMIHAIGSAEDGQESIRQLEFVLRQFIPLEELHLPLIINGEPHREDGVSFRDFAELLDHNLLASIDLSKPLFTRSATKGRYLLSSGERSLLIFCVSTFLLTRGGALVLIDEPENHLHPAFISILMKAFVGSLVATESRAVVVTHSPFVVRELDRSAVMILQRGSDGHPELFRPSLQTLGGDVSMIADHVFQDGSIKKDYERRIDAVIAERKAGGAEIDTVELERDLGNDGARYLHEQLARLRG